MLDSCCSLITAAALFWLCWGLGHPIVVRGRWPLQHALEQHLWGVATGLTLAVAGLALAGLCGALQPAWIVAFTLLGIAWASTWCWLLRRGSRRLVVPIYTSAPDAIDAHAARLIAAAQTRESSDTQNRSFRQILATLALPDLPRWLSWVCYATATAAMFATLLTALAPPTAGDALCYHLELPQQFLRSGGLVYLPDTAESTFPQFVELLFLWGLVLDGPVAAQLMHWGLGLLLVLATGTWAARLLGTGWGGLAACLVALVPAINNQMTAPLNDVGLACFSVFVLWSWTALWDAEEPRRWLMPLAMATAAVLSIKFTGGVLVLAIGAVSLLWNWRPGWNDRHCGTLVIALTVGLVSAAPWYARAAYHTGNPVAPYLQSVFTPRTNEIAALPVLRESKRPLTLAPSDVLSAPFQVTFFPHRFGGRAHQLGPIFLLCLPGYLWLCLDPRWRPLLAVALLYACAWYLLKQNVRFLLPVVPLAIVLTARLSQAVAASTRLPRAAWCLVLLAVCGFEGAIAVRRAVDKLPVAVGWETREAFLARSEPSFPVAQLAAAVLPANAVILSQEQRAFYFSQRLVREHLFRLRTGYPAHLSSPAALSSTLRQAGFSHLLLARLVSGTGAAYEPTLQHCVQAAQRHHALLAPRRVAITQVTSSDGSVREYELLELPPPPLQTAADCPALPRPLR